MASQKVSVTLDKSAVARARAMAGPRGLSNYVDAALQEKLERDERRAAFLDLVEELNAIDPPTPEERRRGEARAARLLEAAAE